jgi:DNA polymerase V
MPNLESSLVYKIDYLPIQDSYYAFELTPGLLRGREQDGALVPIFSMAVQCGLFGIQDDHIENYLSLDERFIKNKHSTFIFKMEGDSMSPQIDSGDYLIVDRSLTHFMDRIVVVDLYDERMCKFLTRSHGQLVLRSLNNKYQDIVINDEMDLHIFGVATLCFKDLVRKV